MHIPETEKHWTTVYFGARGSCKTLHQGKETVYILQYLEKLYKKKPQLHRALVFTNQKFNEKIESLYLNRSLFYWEDVDDFKYCPRKNCWLGKEKHRLHGAYLIFDDVTTILPPDSWATTPLWLRKTFAQARHNGIRILANLQDPFAVDINFRRYVDMAYRFTKVFGSRDPDDTKPPVKRIFGIYRRRRIKAEMLWKYGNMPEQQIRLMLIEKARLDESLKKAGREFDIVLDDSWRGSYHFFTRKNAEIYDTTQNVKEYEPKGYICKEYRCIDPSHNHTDPDAPNYCNYKKKVYTLV